MSEFQTLVTAALLHDIGKFYQRTGKPHDAKYKELSKDQIGLTGAHAKWGADFALQGNLGSVVEELILYHHRPEALSDPHKQFLAKIIQQADHISAMEREPRKEEAPAEVRKEPLISIFSKITLSGNIPPEYYYPLTTLDLAGELIFPRETKKEAMKGWHLQPEYEELWKNFIAEMKLISAKEDWFIELYYLLKKYTVFIPSAAYMNYPDIALFDHLKASAAIAAVLYRYCISRKNDSVLPAADEQAFLLIYGDMSGIQKFLYQLQSPEEAQKGMAKRLRGRSNYLKLLNEAIALHIVNTLELAELNILWCGGGHFLIVAPNTPEANATLTTLHQAINTRLLRKFNGELYLALGSKAASASEFSDFASLRLALVNEVGIDKRRKFHGILQDLFSEESAPPKESCIVCGNVISPEERICKDCKAHEKQGQMIANADFLIRVRTEQNQDQFQFCEFGYGYNYYKFAAEKSPSAQMSDFKKFIQACQQETEPCVLFALNTTQFLDPALVHELDTLKIPLHFAFDFLGNLVPTHSALETLDFDRLANLSTGGKKLGCLRMDVDNLGLIFALGLRNQSVSRVQTLSSMLDLFFLGYLNRIAQQHYVLEQVCDKCLDKVVPISVKFVGEEKLELFREKSADNRVCEKCQTQKVPLIYINYSGGDDLLLIGPWDVMIEAATAIQSKFDQFVCHNPDITLSGGIFIGDPKFPIGRSAEEAGEILEKSKDSRKNLELAPYSSKDQGKNRITVFSETLCWNSVDQILGFNDLLGFAKDLEGYCRPDQRRLSRAFIYKLLGLWEDTFGTTSKLTVKRKLEMKTYLPYLKYMLARSVRETEFRESLDKALQRAFPWIRVPVSWVSLRTR